MNQEQLVSAVVQQVLQSMQSQGRLSTATSSATAGSASRQASHASGPGLTGNVDAAVEQAHRSQRQLEDAGLEVRGGICDLLKQMAKDNADAWGRMEIEETNIGRLDHKIAKLELLQGVPGVEFLKTVAHSGDSGITLDEAAPWGVIGVITPVTHSIPTLTANAIAMIASGNAMVVNPHPGGSKCASIAAAEFNKAIKQRFNIDPLINVITPPTLRSAEQIFQHKDIPLLVVTGGPGVARAALKQTKRAIVAGPGNPPVVVDETADMDVAAQAIIAGGGFDNNLLCIGEKEVFVVASVFEDMMAAMRKAGAVQLNSQQIQRLTEKCFTYKDGHYAVNKDYIGKDPHVLGEAIGMKIDKSVELIFGQTDEDNPFVPEEQMMPFVPFVKVRNFEEALAMAIKYEHGFGHTAIIHSNNLANITRMGKAMNTTLFVANGPCTAALGAGGEGYPSYSIATPTGEGVTNPMTFTRFRRNSVAGSLRIV